MGELKDAYVFRNMDIRHYRVANEYIDLKEQSRNYNTWINDIQLYIPPENIQIAKTGNTKRIPVLRSPSSIKIQDGKSDLAITMSIPFPCGIDGRPDQFTYADSIRQINWGSYNNPIWNYKLKPLLLQIKKNPYIVVEDEFLASQVDPSFKGASDLTTNIIPLVVENVNVATIPGVPNTLNLTLTCCISNFKPFTNSTLFRRFWKYGPEKCLRVANPNVFPDEEAELAARLLLDNGKSCLELFGGEYKSNSELYFTPFARNSQAFYDFYYPELERERDNPVDFYDSGMTFIYKKYHALDLRVFSQEEAVEQGSYKSTNDPTQLISVNLPYLTINTAAKTVAQQYVAKGRINAKFQKELQEICEAFAIENMVRSNQVIPVMPDIAQIEPKSNLDAVYALAWASVFTGLVDPLAKDSILDIKHLSGQAIVLDFSQAWTNPTFNAANFKSYLSTRFMVKQLGSSQIYDVISQDPGLTQMVTDKEIKAQETKTGIKNMSDLLNFAVTDVKKKLQAELRQAVGATNVEISDYSLDKFLSTGDQIIFSEIYSLNLQGSGEPIKYGSNTKEEIVNEVIVEAIQYNISNNIVKLSMDYYDYPITQFMGGHDGVGTINLMAFNENGRKVLENFQHMYDQVKEEIRLFKTAASLTGIVVQNTFLNKLVGVNNVFVENIVVATIPTSPGAMNVEVDFTDVTLNRSTATKQNQENLLYSNSTDTMIPVLMEEFLKLLKKQKVKFYYDFIKGNETKLWPVWQTDNQINGDVIVKTGKLLAPPPGGSSGTDEVKKISQLSLDEQYKAIPTLENLANILKQLLNEAQRQQIKQKGDIVDTVAVEKTKRETIKTAGILENIISTLHTYCPDFFKGFVDTTNPDYNFKLNREPILSWFTYAALQALFNTESLAHWQTTEAAGIVLKNDKDTTLNQMMFYDVNGSVVQVGKDQKPPANGTYLGYNWAIGRGQLTWAVCHDIGINLAKITPNLEVIDDVFLGVKPRAGQKKGTGSYPLSETRSRSVKDAYKKEDINAIGLPDGGGKLKLDPRHIMDNMFLGIITALGINARHNGKRITVDFTGTTQEIEDAFTLIYFKYNSGNRQIKGRSAELKEVEVKTDSEDILQNFRAKFRLAVKTLTGVSPNLVSSQAVKDALKNIPQPIAEVIEEAQKKTPVDYGQVVAGSFSKKKTPESSRTVENKNFQASVDGGYGDRDFKHKNNTQGVIIQKTNEQHNQTDLANGLLAALPFPYISDQYGFLVAFNKVMQDSKTRIKMGDEDIPALGLANEELYQIIKNVPNMIGAHLDYTAPVREFCVNFFSDYIISNQLYSDQQTAVPIDPQGIEVFDQLIENSLVQYQLVGASYSDFSLSHDRVTLADPMIKKRILVNPDFYLYSPDDSKERKAQFRDKWDNYILGIYNSRFDGHLRAMDPTSKICQQSLGTPNSFILPEHTSKLAGPDKGTKLTQDDKNGLKVKELARNNKIATNSSSSNSLSFGEKVSKFFGVGSVPKKTNLPNPTSSSEQPFGYNRTGIERGTLEVTDYAGPGYMPFVKGIGNADMGIYNTREEATVNVESIISANIQGEGRKGHSQDQFVSFQKNDYVVKRSESPFAGINFTDAEVAQSKSTGRYMNSYLNEAHLDSRLVRKHYPTFKLFFIEEDGNDTIWRAYDDFYSINTVQEIRIVKQKDNPADLCYLTIVDLFGKFTNQKFANRQDKIVQPLFGSLKDTAFENPLDSLILKDGTAIQVRLGYENDPNKLPIVFNGKIVSVEDNSSIITVMAQGYGAELVQVRKTPADVPGFWSGQVGNYDVNEILTTMMHQPELKHFGRWKLGNSLFNFTSVRADGKTRWSWKPFSPKDDNILAPTTQDIGSIIKVLNPIRWVAATIFGAFGAKNTGSTWYEAWAFDTYDFSDMTIWEVFQEQMLKHPGFIASPVPYENRATMFFGLPNSDYIFKDTTVIIDKILKTSKSYDDYVRHLFLKYNTADSQDRKKFLLQKLNRTKKFRQYFFVSSPYNIVNNGIKADARDVYNTINVAWPRYGDTGATDPEEAFEEVTLSPFLLDSEVRSVTTPQFKNCKRDLHAIRYGSTLLRMEAQRLYKGSLTILGEPEIKPFDILVINDPVNNMTGPIEVDQVIHTFSTDTGFHTSIVPHMVTTMNDNLSCPTNDAFLALGAAAFSDNVRLDNFGLEFGAAGAIGGLAGGAVGAIGFVGGSVATFLGALSAPLSLVLGAVTLVALSTKIMNWGLKRYPVFMSPLMKGGVPYVYGLDSYVNNKNLTQSLQRNWQLWWEDEKLLENVFSQGLTQFLNPANTPIDRVL